MSSFDITFAVPMECNACVQSVSQSLEKLDGINKFDVSLENQLITVNGNLAPSKIVSAMRDIGKDAIIRGSGGNNSAAVAILEDFGSDDRNVKGLARMIKLNEKSIMVDVTLSGLREQGLYYPSFRKSGNVSEGAVSTGGKLLDLEPILVKEKDEAGYYGQSFVKCNVGITDLIGRSLVVSKGPEITKRSFCGVIARSAGCWENMKQVCSCTGKTLWQERQDAVARGVKM